MGEPPAPIPHEGTHPAMPLPRWSGPRIAAITVVSIILHQKAPGAGRIHPAACGGSGGCSGDPRCGGGCMWGALRSAVLGALGSPHVLGYK